MKKIIIVGLILIVLTGYVFFIEYQYWKVEKKIREVNEVSLQAEDLYIAALQAALEGNLEKVVELWSQAKAKRKKAVILEMECEEYLCWINSINIFYKIKALVAAEANGLFLSELLFTIETISGFGTDF